MRFPYKLIEVDEIGNIAKGTQIAVRHAFKDLDPTLAKLYPLYSSDGHYEHHGVYMGSYNEKIGDCKVVHFSGRDKVDAKPRATDILKFSKNSVDRKLYVVEYDDPQKLLPVEETLEKAYDMLQNPAKWPPYQVLINNCESFATWLKTGEMISAQVAVAAERVVDILTIATGISKMSSKVSRT